MFDLVSMAAFTLNAAIVVFFLSSALSRNSRQRSVIAIILAGWFGLVVTAASAGAFSNRTAAGMPLVGLGVLIPLAVLSLFVLGRASGRELVRRIPLASLTAIQAVRVLGIIFVLLYTAKRLPAPFAPVAGWGDVAVGLLAVPLALRLRSNADAVPKGLISAFNALGIIDLVTALTLGVTSSPGPIQLFHGQPSAAIMSTLPWVLIPCFLVPLFLVIHLCSFYRLRMLAPAEPRQKLDPTRVTAPSL